MGCHFLLHEILPTQGSNPGLPHCRQMLYRLSHQGSLQFSSVVQSCLTLCNPMNRSMPGFPLLHYYPKYDHPLVAQRVKHLPAMQETWVPSLGQEDPLEKEMATHFSILPGEAQGQRSLAGYRPRGHKRLSNSPPTTAKF